VGGVVIVAVGCISRDADGTVCGSDSVFETLSLEGGAVFLENHLEDHH